MVSSLCFFCNYLRSSSGCVKGTSRIRSTREDKAKVTVAEQISQAVQSTSKLLNLMQRTSASQAPKPITSPVPVMWYPSLAFSLLAIGLVIIASFFISYPDFDGEKFAGDHQNQAPYSSADLEW